MSNNRSRSSSEFDTNLGMSRQLASEVYYTELDFR